MKKRISFIDICIILLVAVLALAGYFILKPMSQGAGETASVTFTVLGTKQEVGLSELIKPEDDVIISFSEDVHATVVEAYEEPSKEHYFNSFSGKYVTGKLADKSDVYVKLTCDAVISDTDISKDSLQIRVGDEMPVRGKGYVVKGYVIEVSEE